MLVLVSPAWRTIYNYTLILLFALSVSTILASFLVATFIMAMNPSGKRHWRHMTLGVCLVLISEIVAYMLLLLSGVTIADLTFAFGPLVVGAGALLCVVFMKTGERGEVDGAEKAA
jgi:hypothetical protein